MNLVGLDEVGRGCWAGPLVAAAVLLKNPIDGLKDSKLLSRNKRQELLLEIQANACVGIGWVSPAQIDHLGLSRATAHAMEQSLKFIKQFLIKDTKIIIDGNTNFLKNCQLTKKLSVIPMVKADQTEPAVCAASIVAKVSRDAYMRQQADNYPLYKFDKHVGYGTKIHKNMIEKHGICVLHRKSFKPIKQIYAVPVKT